MKDRDRYEIDRGEKCANNHLRIYNQEVVIYV